MSLVCKLTRLSSEILDSDWKAGGRKPGEDVEEEYVAKWKKPFWKVLHCGFSYKMFLRRHKTGSRKTWWLGEWKRMWRVRSQHRRFQEVKWLQDLHLEGPDGVSIPEGPCGVYRETRSCTWDPVSLSVSLPGRMCHSLLWKGSRAFSLPGPLCLMFISQRHLVFQVVVNRNLLLVCRRPLDLQKKASHKPRRSLLPIKWLRHTSLDGPPRPITGPPQSFPHLPALSPPTSAGSETLTS